MKISPKQELHIRNVRAAAIAWRTAKADALMRARQLAEREVADYLLAMDREVRLANDAGVPSSRIYREGLGTKNPHSFYESMKRTAHTDEGPLARRENDPNAGRYAWNEQKRLVVTLTGSAWDSATDELDWDAGQALEAGLNMAVFDWDGSTLVPSIAPEIPDNLDWLQRFGNRHPVIVWMQLATNAEEALAWASQ
ncbi:hypothetical protein [Frigoribacterium sp. UYMn621]|uniref:hypothetical protein n=1 Tax=Frigoribacterium sp. UYMn621 TaxID=3156343 RepID=UPI0033989168